MKGSAIWESARDAFAAWVKACAPWECRTAVLLPLVCWVALCVSACVPGEVVEKPSPLATLLIDASAVPTQTPFKPISATETPDILRVWISPALPAALKTPIETLSQQGLLVIEENPAEAGVRVEPHGAIELSEWIYALVAPFPTVRDGMDGRELVQNWGEVGSIHVSPETLPAVEMLLGPASEAVVVGHEQDPLLDIVWEERIGYAIVPFETLEPRWKVLAVNGMSPIHKTFETESYALNLPFGLSGDPTAVERLRAVLDWPESNRDDQRLTVLVMTGTTALTRDVTWKMDQNGMQYPAMRIGDWLRDADLTHISHEVAFSETCPSPTPLKHTMRFCGSPRHRELLEFVGVDVIELSGNHLLDWGRPAFLETLMGYRELGWGTFGGGIDISDAFQAYSVEHNGNLITFMGCNEPGPPSVWASVDSPGAAPCDMEYFSTALQEHRERGAITIFTFQWLEGSTVLRAQKKAFREAVDAGAMIVSGSQAHKPLGLEFYAGGFIHYGLGNLFFDQMQTLDNRREIIDRHVFYDGKHISTELLTALLEDYSQPRPMTTVERSEFLEKIFQDSEW
jgi:hypothetical protein